MLLQSYTSKKFANTTCKIGRATISAQRHFRVAVAIFQNATFFFLNTQENCVHCIRKRMKFVASALAVAVLAYFYVFLYHE